MTATDPTVTAGTNGLVLRGHDGELPLFSAEVHPWRLDPAHWERVLDTLVELGFRSICTYVSWARHEVGPGTYRFDGPFDIERFLALVHRRGLKAIVRLGPNTAAEQEDSGWPRRILDDPECQARRPNGLPYVLLSSTGHCFPPSYASTKVREQIAGWYDAVVPRLAALQHPDGPVVLAQVDNELGYHFQANTYALDHHPDAIALYRAWCGDQNALVPSDASDGAEEDRLRWVAWKEEHLRETLATLAAMIRARGLDRVPLFHNDYPRTTTPMDIGALERSDAVDIAAADIYSTREGGVWVRDLARHLAGSSRLPFLAELGAGWLTLPWLLPLRLTGADEEHVGVRALGAGVRATNVYMAVERDRWYGSPVGADGARRPLADLYPRLIAVFEDLRAGGFERVAPVLVLENRAESRRRAARDTLGGVVPSFTQLLPIDRRLTNLPDAGDDRLQEWERSASDALQAAGVDSNRAVSSSLPDLTRYEVVVLPVVAAVEPEVADALEQASGAGVHIVVGPERGGLGSWATVLEDGADLQALVPAPPFASDDDRVDIHTWRGPEGRTLVFACSGTGDVVHTHLRFDGSATFTGLWRDEKLAGVGSVELHLDPWGVQIWEATA